jgi:hypothetical protein
LITSRSTTLDNISFQTTGPVSTFDGELFSSSNTTTFVDCPLYAIGPTDGIKIHYIDSSAAGNFRCYGYIRQLGGTLVFSPSVFSCSVNGGCSTNSEPNFASSTQGSIDLTSFRGFSGVTCELPPGGSIRMIEEIFQ